MPSGCAAARRPVGSVDIQSLADLINSFEVVRTMQIAPITKDALLRLIAATLAPCCAIGTHHAPGRAAEKVTGHIVLGKLQEANAQTPLTYVDESPWQCCGFSMIKLL